MASDDGIAFYNKQQFTSVTPVWDFQNRIAADAAGPASRQALPVQCDHLRLGRADDHDRAPQLGAPDRTLLHSRDRRCDHLGPTEGHGMGRAIAGMIGMDQEAINQKVNEGATRPSFSSRFPAKRSRKPRNESRARRPSEMPICAPRGWSATARSRFRNRLPDHRPLARSRPEGVLVAGRLSLRRMPTGSAGADMPQLPRHSGRSSRESGPASTSARCWAVWPPAPTSATRSARSTTS